MKMKLMLAFGFAIVGILAFGVYLRVTSPIGKCYGLINVGDDAFMQSIVLKVTAYDSEKQVYSLKFK